MTERPSLPGHAQEYWADPNELAAIGDYIRAEAPSVTSYADLCQRIAPSIAEELQVRGAENIPTAGPLIVIKNHPCHFDSMLLGEVFSVRPDVRPLIKVASFTEGIPEDTAVFLRKEGPHADRGDVRAMQAYLASGGSMLAVPWGSMDHQARAYADSLRAVRNVIRYASFADANVLPVTIQIEPYDPTIHFPVKRAVVDIHPAVLATPEGLDEDEISQVVSDMYERFA